MGRKQLARRDVFYTSAGEHPTVVVFVLPDRYVLASGTHADEPGDPPGAQVSGFAAEKMGLDRRTTKFYKMRITVWNESPPRDAFVVGRCLPSMFPALERLAIAALTDHQNGTRAIQSIPSGSIVPLDLLVGMSTSAPT